MKSKTFADKPRLKSNSKKLTNWLTTGTSDKPMEIPDDAEAPDNAPIVIREEEDEDQGPINLDEIPEAVTEGDRRRSKRRRADSDDALFVGGSEEEDPEAFQYQPRRRSKKKTGPSLLTQANEEEAEEARGDDKKKLSMNTQYDGFSIYGRILCLVVKRKGGAKSGAGAGGPASSQQMLENWVSTQAAAGEQGDNSDEDA